MRIFYKDGFYTEDQLVPENAVEITEEKYTELLNGQSAGRVIISDNSGNPILTSPAPSGFHKWDGSAWVISEDDRRSLIKSQKETLLIMVADRADELKNALLAGYPQAEIASFYKQEKEALAYKENQDAETPMLKMIAKVRGVPFELLVEKVIEKSNQFAVAIGAIIGQRQKFEDRILATDDLAELDNMNKEVTRWGLNLES
ncbi:hypothetical protein [Pasteurella sp. PK-2025]|uniref:hypothetical protein n=1 Tax=Pasteurella sp. PK-2025 TaxID=3413133 RepID=UPI003C77C8FE